MERKAENVRLLLISKLFKGAKGTHLFDLIIDIFLLRFGFKENDSSQGKKLKIGQDLILRNAKI